MSFTVALSKVSQTREQVQGQRILYVRNAGDDANDGLTEQTALLTLAEAVNRLHTGPTGQYRQVINVTGFVDTLTAPVTINTTEGTDAGFADDGGREGAFEDGKLDAFNFPFELMADPLLVQSITISNQVADAVTDLVTLTVDETLIEDAHVGQWVDGGIGVIGTIHSNTANTITVSAATGFSSSANIYTQSCVLTCDVYAALTFICEGSLMLSGIKTVSSANFTTMSVTGRSKFYIQQCNIFGIESPRHKAASGQIDISWSYLSGKNFWIEGMTQSLHNCVVQDTSLIIHGSGGYGLNTVELCIYDGCTAIGGGNHESSVDVEINKTLIINGTTHGVDIKSPFGSVVRDTRINDCAGDAINVNCGGGIKIIDNVAGTGNAGWGLNLTNGAQAQVVNGTTVSGASGQVSLGAAGATLYSALPATDVGEAIPQFCRAF